MTAPLIARCHGKVPEGRESEGEGRLSWLVQSNWAEERSVSFENVSALILVFWHDLHIDMSAPSRPLSQARISGPLHMNASDKSYL